MSESIFDAFKKRKYMMKGRPQGLPFDFLMVIRVKVRLFIQMF